MELQELMQLGSGFTPAILVWIAMELRGVRKEMLSMHGRIEKLEAQVFFKGVRA